MGNMTNFERQAIDFILEGNEYWKRVLRSQVPCLSVINRTDTVVGGFTNFEKTNAGTPLLEVRLDNPPGINVKHLDMPDGGTIILWLDKGYIDYLEWVSFTNTPWPKDAELKDFQVID